MSVQELLNPVGADNESELDEATDDGPESLLSCKKQLRSLAQERGLQKVLD